MAYQCATDHPGARSPLLRWLGGAWLAGALTGLPVAAAADGEFAQLDVSASTTGGVSSIQRGPLTFSGVVTLPDGDPSATLSLTMALPVPSGLGIPTLRLGPSVGFSGDGLSEVEGGARLVVERYTGSSFGGVYLLAEANTVDRAWFLLGQVGLAAPKLTVELSRGSSDTYDETTLAVARRLGDLPFSLRAGYRFEASEGFLGVSFNTF